MSRHARALPIVSGAGSVAVARTLHAVDYQIATGDKLKSGRGSATGDPEAMRSAFSAGDATLTLEDGRPLSVFFMAHTAGSETAYFEVRRLS
ncbi:MAG: hypothetical protein WA840_21550 [Caulobacteraceae bacterium]